MDESHDFTSTFTGKGEKMEEMSVIPDSREQCNNRFPQKEKDVNVEEGLKGRTYVVTDL